MNLPSTFAIIKNRTASLVMILFSLLPAAVNAQSVTNIDMTSTVIQSGVERLGMNIGNHDFYDSGQLTKNLIFRNPGFEPQIYQSTIRCQSGTATTCTDDDAWSAFTPNFWQGATYEFIYGTAIGRTGTVTASTAPANGNGAVFTFNASGTVPAQGDYVIVRQSIRGNPTSGWWTSTQGAATLTPETADLPPGTQGVQALRVTAPTSNDSATVAQYFDGTAGISFVQLNGQFQLSFKAKGTAGSQTIQVAVYRSGGANFLSETVNLTAEWNTYNLSFAASENGTAVGAMNVILTAAGPTGFILDDVSLQQTNGSATNPTQYRDAVVSALKQYSPGTLRYWDNQLGESLDNWITPPFGRKPAGYSAWSTSATDISIGLHEFLQLCQTIGAEPWVVVPLVFDPAEASNLIEYLSGPATSTYGAKRAALGQSAPWTSVFGKIHLELGNEAWNSGFKGGDMEYSDAYGIYSNAVFGAMRANPNFVKSSYDLIVGGQEVYLGRNQIIVDNANQQDTLALAGYLYGTVDSYTSNEELYGPLFAEPEEDNSTSGIYGQNRSLSSSMATYELNLGTDGGAINQATLSEFVPSLGVGLAVADHMLMMMRDLGVHPINIWQLGQYNLGFSDGETAPMFGVVVDMGVTNRRRPQFLAAALANTAVGGDMIQAVQGGSGPDPNPTWNQPLENGVQFSAAHYIQSYAFSNGASRSVILFNLHRTNALQVTFSDVNAPQGTVQVQRLGSANITDGNETSQKVGVTASTLTGFNPATPYTLPAYSMTVLTWTAPDVSNVEVAVTPGTTILGPAGKQQLTATVQNSSNQAVTWSMNPGVGTISSTGMYAAPASFSTAQSVIITATSAADKTKTGTATISLAPSVMVNVVPSNVSMTALQTKQFTASVLNTSNTAVVWSIYPGAGTISSTGLYTAPSLISVPGSVTVTATSTASPTSHASQVITLTPSGTGAFSTIAINAGGAAYTDPTGLEWRADSAYTGGGVTTVTNAIANSKTPTIYQSQRWNNFSYSMVVPNGTYQITMKFAELFWAKTGQRVFNILVNGKTVISNFDIVAAAGANFTAVDKVVTTTVTNGSIELTFGAIVDLPTINGIEVVKVNSVGISPTTVSLTPGQSKQFTASGGTGSSYSWTISPSVGTISSTGLYTAPAAITSAQTVTVSVTNSGSSAGTATGMIGLVPPAPAIALNAGGGSYQDASGQVWSADAGFVGGQAYTGTSAIAGTTTPTLYQTDRWGMTSYSWSVPNGTYKLTLKFAELFWTQAGQRVFNVSVNGQQILTNFDILASAGGRDMAIDKTFTVNVTSGQVALEFSRVTDYPLVSAIELMPN